MKNKGQIGLILLIILGLLLTLIMSLASRTLTDTALSRQEKEQSATFSIAESGVEEALRTLRAGEVPSGTLPITDSLSQIIGQYQVTTRNGLEIYLREGEVAELNLTGLTPTLVFSWTKRQVASENLACVSEGSGRAPAAIEVMAVNGSSNALVRSYYNGYNCSLGNGFAMASDGNSDYLSKLTWTVPSGVTAVRVRPLYNGATISVTGVALSTQQYDIQAQATGGDAQKEIEVRRSRDSSPSIFDFALFSGSTIVK